MTSVWIPSDNSNGALVSVGDTVPGLTKPTGFVHTRPSGYTLAPSLQVAFDNDVLPALYVQAFQHDDVKILFDGYDASSGGLGTFCSSPNGTFVIAKNGGTLYISGGNPGAGKKISFTTCLSTDVHGNVSVPGALNATTATLGQASVITNPTIPEALHIWVKTLPATTVPSNTGHTQPITPYSTVFQLNGQFPDNAYFDSYGRFVPPVTGIWHFGSLLSVTIPINAYDVSMTFQTNATDGTTNMLSTTQTVVAGTSDPNIGLHLTGTALLDTTDYVNLYVYYSGPGSATTNNNAGTTNFFATLIQRTA